MSEMECSFYDGICKSPINKSDLECSLIPIERCYYKQLQQLKAENKKLHYELGKKEGSIYKLQQCFDEIENIGLKGCCNLDEYECNKYYTCDFCMLSTIQQLIKHVKEGEE